MKITHLACTLALASGVCARADVSSILEKPVKGTPEIGAINAINFAPDGVLLIGDGKNKQILAIDTGDRDRAEGDFSELKGVRKEIAGRLGAKTEDVAILDVAVNPASGRLYIALRKQDEQRDVIVRLSPGGEMEPVSLENVSHVRVPLPSSEDAPISTISDVIWAGDRLVAAARANEEFASKIFAAEGPLHHDRTGQIYSAETYHISHRKWETKAPMSVMIPYEEDGKQYIVGAFSCTPVVKYPLDAIQPGAKIKGISMLELGSGNRPLNMFSYKGKDGKRKVLTNTFRFHHEKRPFGPSPHLAFQFDEDILEGQEKVNEEAVRRLDEKTPEAEKVQIAEPFHGVVHMDRLDDSTALALREAGDDFDLVAIALP